jgi:hypothetical protein
MKLNLHLYEVILPKDNIVELLLGVQSRHLTKVGIMGTMFLGCAWLSRYQRCVKFLGAQLMDDGLSHNVYNKYGWEWSVLLWYGYMGYIGEAWASFRLFHASFESAQPLHMEKVPLKILRHTRSTVDHGYKKQNIKKLNLGHFTHETEGPRPLHSKVSHWSKRLRPFKFTWH